MTVDAFEEERPRVTEALKAALLQWPPDGDVVDLVKHLNAEAARAARGKS